MGSVFSRIRPRVIPVSRVGGSSERAQIDEFLAARPDVVAESWNACQNAENAEMRRAQGALRSTGVNAKAGMQPEPEPDQPREQMEVQVPRGAGLELKAQLRKQLSSLGVHWELVDSVDKLAWRLAEASVQESVHAPAAQQREEALKKKALKNVGETVSAEPDKWEPGAVVLTKE